MGQDGHGARDFVRHFRQREFRSQLEMVRTLHLKAEFGMDERPSADSGVGTDAGDDVLADGGIVHQDVWFQAAWFSAEVERLLRG